MAVFTLAAAIISAVYWFKSAAVPMPEFQEPVASITDAPEQHIIAVVSNTELLHGALLRSSDLNTRAAIWTGVSALLGAATTVYGILG
jgi:hypothetical protein